MIKLSVIALFGMKFAKALDCNLATENVCGSGICLSDGNCLVVSHESVKTDNFLEKIYERSNAVAAACTVG